MDQVGDGPDRAGTSISRSLVMKGAVFEPVFLVLQADGDQIGLEEHLERRVIGDLLVILFHNFITSRP